MSRCLIAVCALLLLSSACLAQQKPAPAAPASAPAATPMAPSQEPRKRVAVMSFDYGTVMSSVQAIFGTNQDVGRGISDLLVMKLVNDGKYSVIERAALEKVLGEQNLSNSNRADSSTAAKIGKVLGVEVIIIGTVTQFGRDEKKTTVGGGRFGLGKIGLGGVQSRNAKAVVAVTARMIDTSTGEILGVAEGNGESARAGTSLVGGGAASSDGGDGAFDMSSSNFGATILGEAVHKAVDSLGQQLDDKAAAMPTDKVEISGLVADVSGNSLILNVGSKSGVRVGDVLQITRVVRTVKDPATGKVIKSITNKIGDAKVTEVDENSATVIFTGTDVPKVGDAVSNQ
jgi:curli biogenesis system outer membrane secretion channel CsgG